jgi:LuxR family transcriptional regulator, maltose regulon positive regulatory protein
VRSETGKSTKASHPSAAGRVDPVVAARFKVPRQTKGLLPRPRLVERLELGVAGPLTLVSAPAGTGKTVLVSSWAGCGQAPGPVAWVALEAGDASRTSFWSSFIQGLERCGVVLPRPSARAQTEVDHDYLDLMAAALSERSEPVVVVLDCEAELSAAVAADLDWVLRRSGGWLRLVVVTRVDPVLPLHRYRLAGTVVEIRMADLAFTLEESRALLSSVGVDLSDTAMQAIVGHTQGWAAGLRFAAISLTRRKDQERAALEFSGDTGNVAEYLIAEVLDAQPAGGRQLLLESSIVDVLRPGLSEAVAGPHAQRALAFLVRGNAFLDELADSPGCYRYHPLFRELLRAQLAYESPVRILELHRAAATWLASHGLTEDAVRHSASAGDWEGAARHVVDDLAIGRLLLPGADVLRGVLSRLPDDTEGAAASLVRAARAISVADVEACDEHLLRAERELELPGAPHWTAAELAVQIVRLIHARALADAERGLEAAAAAESLLPLLAPDRLGEHPELEVIIASSKGAIWMATGQVDEAGEAFSAGARAADRPGFEHAHVDCLGHLALLSALRGQLRKAGNLATRAAAVQEEAGISSAGCPRAGEVALAWVSTELYDLPAARRHAQRAAESHVVGDGMASRVMLALVDARVRRARGDLDGALTLIATARSETPSAPRWLQDLLQVEEAELDVVNGHPALAVRKVAALTEPTGAEGAVVLARATLAIGEMVEIPATTLRSTSVPLPTRVAGWILEASRQLDSGEPRRAAQALERALRLAAPERLRRPFREAPPQVRQLLRWDKQVATRHSWLGASLCDESRPVPRPRRGMEPEDSSDQLAPGPILEPLTEKEREVLGHLAALLTTDEIAGAMFVSVNTVRTHVRNILRKLAASRRNEAVRRARELQLIPRQP